MLPKLSIIIPCFNCQTTLREAVESCYLQGFKETEFEIVMVDDGSTDNTYKLMEELSKEHTNINIFQHQKNQGGGATRNTAVSHTQTEVIFCLDSDDILPPNTLDTMYSYLKEKGCDGVCIHHSVKFNGKNSTDIDHVDILPYAGEKIPFESVFQAQGVCPVYLVFLYTKDSFTRAGGYPTNHGFDTQGFGWRFLAAGLSAYTCPNTKYLHRMNNGDSYYIREYNQGKINYNWQKILFEHLYLFDISTQDFIRKFNYSDFTQDAVVELLKRKTILKKNYQELLGSSTPSELTMSETKPIHRNSLRGIFMRLKKKLSI